MRQRGFTLIEVVVAFAILALSLGALYQSFSVTLRQSQRIEKRELALLEAQSLLARVGKDLPLRAGTTAGRLDSKLDWSVAIAEYARPTPTATWPVPAYDVAVEVRWGPSDSERVALRSLELGAQP